MRAVLLDSIVITQTEQPTTQELDIKDQDTFFLGRLVRRVLLPVSSGRLLFLHSLDTHIDPFMMLHGNQRWNESKVVRGTIVCPCKITEPLLICCQPYISPREIPIGWRL